MFSRAQFRLKLPSRTLQLGEGTLIMGVLNVTPDSFSDGGNFYAPERAIRHALQMENDGAHLIDVGAESTRPGASDISAEDEWARLAPVLTALRTRLRIPMSIDTGKAEIAEKAVGAGAEIINDVSGLRHDPRVAEVAARLRVPLILMHMRGDPRTMQRKPFARNVLADVTAGLRKSIALARKAGVQDSKIVIDPGIGFGKSFAQNYELLNRLPQLAKLGFAILVGTSRKGFIGHTLGRNDEPAPPDVRIWGTAATVTASILQGAHIVRVHDVLEMSRVARVADHIQIPNLAIHK